jgi:IS66 C-terminal element
MISPVECEGEAESSVVKIENQILHALTGMLSARRERQGRPDAGRSDQPVHGCENLGIDPQAYLCDVLDRISTHPARRIEELLPDRWQELRQPATLQRTDRPLARGSSSPRGMTCETPIFRSTKSGCLELRTPHL